MSGCGWGRDLINRNQARFWRKLERWSRLDWNVESFMMTAVVSGVSHLLGQLLFLAPGLVLVCVLETHWGYFPVHSLRASAQILWITLLAFFSFLFFPWHLQQLPRFIWADCFSLRFLFCFWLFSACGAKKNIKGTKERKTVETRRREEKKKRIDMVL